MITLRPGICDHFNQMIKINYVFYLEIFNKWDVWKVVTISGDNINRDYNKRISNNL